MANIYVGNGSCYNVHRGYFVKQGRVIYEVIGILYLLLRDLRRGKTYNHECREIKMTSSLFRKRVRYIYTIYSRKLPRKYRDQLKRLLAYVLKKKKLPRSFTWGDRRLYTKSILRKAITRGAVIL